MHGAEALFLAPHIEGARRAILVGADRRFAADAPGILVAVFLEIISDVCGFVFAVDRFHPAVLDRELDRIFPAALRHVRGGVPDDGAVGRAGNRLDVNFTPRPGTAGEPARLLADPRWRFAPALGVVVGRISGNIRGKVAAGFRCDVDFFALVVDLADAPADVAALFHVFKSRLAAAFGEDLHRRFFHQENTGFAGVPYLAQSRRPAVHAGGRQR